ncbi:protein-tyrosine-phosphatase [Bacterioplanes sanyensis]|uniref:protein-tyrosine-phosphatase n=1 Tax=Bacterioplanes sanyensis TaxID=1249553 RepID=A0A222FMK7_9GAMM|nr:low molecular weight protein-tyrosine-phosphatase [Bacterioplanes sanyensis]ASP39979.1 protein-tyrosine-phosphatase [Bacterioplanes sanyensis]
MTSVLFVCLGNICRSPTAHGVFQHYVDSAGLGDTITVDSAGTGDWHVGKAPDGRSQQAAARRGYDLSPLRARQAKVSDLAAFDYVLAMDHNNLSVLSSWYQGKPEQTKPQLFLATYGAGQEVEVPDPYYGGEQGFEQVLDLIEQASERLLQQIQATL